MLFLGTISPIHFGRYFVVVLGAVFCISEIYPLYFSEIRPVRAMAVLTIIFELIPIILEPPLPRLAKIQNIPKRH